MTMTRSRVLVAGWFSYVHGHATAGDVIASEVLVDWLRELGFETVLAVAPPFQGGPNLNELDPTEFTHAFFVCGPFGPGPLERDFVTRFAGCRLVGVNLSIEGDFEGWHPFDFLISRDGPGVANPDLVFAGPAHPLPLIGVCLREPHPSTDTVTAEAGLSRLLDRHGAVRIPIDTRLDRNSTGLRTAAEVEGAIAGMHAIVTTRLHGLVLALKNGVPAIAVDAVPGGGKLTRQAARIGWPLLLGLEQLDDASLDRAWRYALGAEGRELARRCASRASEDVAKIADRLTRALTDRGAIDSCFERRQSGEGLRDFRARIGRLDQPTGRTAAGRLLWRFRARYHRKEVVRTQ